LLLNIAVFRDNEYSEGAYRRPGGERLFEAGKGIETVLFILFLFFFGYGAFYPLLSVSANHRIRCQAC